MFTRHAEVHKYLVQELKKLGLSMMVDPACCLPMLNAVTIPQAVDDAAIRVLLLKEFDREIGAGLGALAGKIWRIGIMGHTARKENVDKVISALKKVL